MAKKIDPHEMMTAALILRSKEVSVNSLNSNLEDNTVELVNKLASVAEEVGGGTGGQGFFSEVDDTRIPKYKDLAKAISISNYVLEQLPNGAKIENVWQTGRGWSDEITRFNPTTGTMKNYNSSDIVLKIETKGKNEATHFWGISLKKRGAKEGNPTMLNKPVVGPVGFLTGRLTSTVLNKIDTDKEKFFRQALNIATGGTYKNKDITKFSMSEVLKACDQIFHGKMKFKRDMLTGSGIFGKTKTNPKGNPNIYFKAMDKAFMDYVNNKKNSKKFFEEFFDLIFKINLDTYINDAAFHFSLITGTGDFNIPRQQMEVHDAQEYEGRLTSEIFREMFKDPDHASFVLKRQEGPKKLHAWQKGATAAKLFYEMVVGQGTDAVSIVDLEVRYKGHLTTEPQFQVFVNKVRQNGFHKKYSQVAKEVKLGDRRWK